MHKKLLRIENAAVFLLLLVLYHNFGLSWRMFMIFILFPDVFMLGYLKDSKLGARIYNIGHSYAFPIGIVIASMATDSLFLATLSAIWAMHIAVDRAMGLGLKLEKGFKHTHLSK